MTIQVHITGPYTITHYTLGEVHVVSTKKEGQPVADYHATFRDAEGAEAQFRIEVRKRREEVEK